MKPESQLTVRGWHNRMRQYGQSTRLVPLDSTDFSAPETYPDPKGIKNERTALGAIFCIRAYQRAKETLLSKQYDLSQPPFASITTFDTLQSKAYRIGDAFMHAMIDGVLADEAEILSRPKSDPVVAAYERLEETFAPFYHEHKGKKIVAEIESIGREVENPSGAVKEVFAGIEVLPATVVMLMEDTFEEVGKQTQQVPDIARVLKIMKNSYKSFIKPLAELHKADSLYLEEIDAYLRENNFKMTELKDETIKLVPEVEAMLAEQKQETRKNLSKTARCSFLVNPEQIKDFLDKPADYSDPLEDSFNLYVQLLAA